MDDTDEEAAMRDKIRAEEEAFAVEKIAVQRVHDLQEDLNILTREVGRAAVQASKLDPQALECPPPWLSKFDCEKGFNSTFNLKPAWLLSRELVRQPLQRGRQQGEPAPPARTQARRRARADAHHQGGAVQA